MIINVTVGSNMQRTSVLVDSSTTLRSVLEDNDVSYDTAIVYFDGNTIKAGDLNKTFDDFNVTEKASIIAVTKTDNGA